MKDLAKARDKLIQRYMNEGIASSESVLNAFKKVPREEFVLPDFRESAYDDHPLPIASGQTISAPHCLSLIQAG